MKKLIFILFALSGIYSNLLAQTGAVLIADSAGHGFTALPINYGTSGYFLQSNGVRMLPSWTAIKGLTCNDTVGGAGSDCGSSQLVTNFSGWLTNGNTHLNGYVNYIGYPSGDTASIFTIKVNGWPVFKSDTIGDTYIGYQAAHNENIERAHLLSASL